MPKVKKSLAETHPFIVKQWHPSKNGELNPRDISAGSNKKVWWKCEKGDDHIWLSDVNSRKRGRGCPVCVGKKVVKSNCLATTHPEIAKQWHPTKNENLTPENVSSGSDKKVWWKCDKGEDHEWKARIANRVLGRKCPVCSGKKIVLSNSLFNLYPNISKKWHPTKNGKLSPKEIGRGSNKKVWWKCDKGEDHEWVSPVYRVESNSCPYCHGKKISLTNSLYSTSTQLSSQWHPTKNKNLTPKQVTQYSHKKVWWKCDKAEDHEWEAIIATRSKGNNCPICSGHKVVKSNSLLFLNPKLSKEWHPTKNKELTPSNMLASSGKKVWWKCDKGLDHEWVSSIYNRNNNLRGCPFCSLTPQSRQELTITFELKKLFKNIDPKGFKTKLDGRLRSIDIFIPKLNLCIEFDGSYWHKGKRELDKIKSEMIFEEGFSLIRVRQEPLKKIYDNNVVSREPYDGKQVSNDVLTAILIMFDLDAKMVSKIKDYQSKDHLQNEKELEKYIEKILEEKAIKN